MGVLGPRARLCGVAAAGVLATACEEGPTLNLNIVLRRDGGALTDGGGLDGGVDAADAGAPTPTSTQPASQLPAQCRGTIDLTRYAFQDKVAPAQAPPHGRTIEEAPQFVAIGWDRNGKLGPMTWSLDVAAQRKNASGTPVTFSYFVTTSSVAAGGDAAALKLAWRRALQEGHDVGLGGATGATTKDTTAAQWDEEIAGGLSVLTGVYTAAPGGGVGFSSSALVGWRTPGLSTNAEVLPVVKAQRLWYDASLEEGVQYDQDGTNNFWPYTLDDGAPGDAVVASWGPNDQKSPVTAVPGLYEIPVYALIVPPDEACEAYGVPAGLRAALKTRQAYFDVNSGRLTGYDTTLWSTFKMTKAEVAATLKYSLDRHLGGNRAPFTFGARADVYDDTFAQGRPGVTALERRGAIEEFLDYAIAKPDVRVRSHRALLEYVREPKAKECY